jgi:anti-anti-sigma regulatory factor
LKTSLLISSPESGKFEVRVSGRLSGFIARKTHSFLHGIIGREKNDVVIDFSEVTSVDSIGAAILDFADEQTGNPKVNLLQPTTHLDDYMVTPCASALEVS